MRLPYLLKLLDVRVKLIALRLLALVVQHLVHLRMLISLLLLVHLLLLLLLLNRQISITLSANSNLRRILSQCLITLQDILLLLICLFLVGMNAHLR